MLIAPEKHSIGLRRSEADAAMARARLCYDRLAGRLGVAICDALVERGDV